MDDSGIPASDPKHQASQWRIADLDERVDVIGISVDARELRDQRGAVVKGLLVEITESQYRNERAFVDADELGELLKGIDALLEVQTNPTRFAQFEVRYTTRGELQLTAYSSGGAVKYAVQAGRVTRATRLGMSTSDIQQLRALFQAAAEKLQAANAR